MSYTLVLNSSNVIGSNNNTFQYKFIAGSFQCKDCDIAIGSLTIPYSWYNVSSYYQNQKFSITFPYAATTATIQFSLPAGFYLVSDINNYIQNICIANGLYLIYNGQNVYYFNVATNATYYNNQITFSLVPTALPTGYSLPTLNTGVAYWNGGAGFTLPTVSTTPYITFPTTNSAGALLGFSAGTYPTAPYTSNQNASSNILPVGSTVNAILVHCNLVSNNITMPSDVIDLIPINSTYGSNISYQPPYEKNVSLCDGTYSSMTITFTDQNNNTLMALDANIAMTLVIKKRKK